jgi:hypothetical protein
MTNDDDLLLLNLEAIKRRHLHSRVEGQTNYLGHIETDLAAVIEENEMLRAMVDRLAAALRSSRE